jgi:hypothetical protein
MNFIKGVWRLIYPFRLYFLRHPFKIFSSYLHYYKDLKLFIRKGGQISFRYLSPYFRLDNFDNQSGGGHYFYQDIWALKIVKSINPTVHYDIGSRYDGFVGQATALTRIIALDIRKPGFVLPNFEFKKDDITNLQIADDSVYSLSCLHTLEHIGLGRYGDKINPNGFVDALMELQRVISPKGYLIISFPIGNPRVEFNAQRIIDPLLPLNLLDKMDMVNFSVITDEDKFIENAEPKDFLNSKYACGLYLFVKR